MNIVDIVEMVEMMETRAGEAGAFKRLDLSRVPSPCLLLMKSQLSEI